MNKALEVLSYEDTLSRIDVHSDDPWAVASDRSSLLTGLYAPRGEDTQAPHEVDEIYVVVSGSAKIEVEGEVQRLATGDAAFVAAHAQHRFLEMSDDFAAWAVFPVTETEPS